MTKPTTVEAYLRALEPDRESAMRELIAVIRARLPEGFEETMQYGMPSWVVPHSSYPPGYHVDPKQPLPFLSVASQRRHIGLYHMGLYANPTLLDWFVDQWPQHCKTKLDMGKSCVRLKKIGLLPYDLVGALCEKMTAQQWIDTYEAQVKPR